MSPMRLILTDETAKNRPGTHGNGQAASDNAPQNWAVVVHNNRPRPDRDCGAKAKPVYVKKANKRLARSTFGMWLFCSGYFAARFLGAAFLGAAFLDAAFVARAFFAVVFLVPIFLAAGFLRLAFRGGWPMVAPAAGAGLFVVINS
jgi:hypothetical protein